MTWLLVFLALATSALAQDRAQRHAVRQWTTRDGLPQNSVADMAQGSDGILWLATHAGVVRFDGAKFEVDDVSTSPILGTSRLTQIEVGKHGDVFVGTGIGRVFRHRGRGWQAVPLPCSCSARIRALETSSDGALWIGAKCGLYRVAPGDEVAERFSDQDVFSIATSQTGEVFVGARSGLTQAQPLADKLLGDFPASHLAVSGTGQLYAGVAGRVLRLESGAWTELPIEVGNVEGLRGGLGEGILVAGVGVVGCWDGEDLEWNAFESQLALPSTEKLLSVFWDREGSRWIGTNTRGLFELANSPLSVITSETQQGDALRSVAMSEDGDLYALGDGFWEVRDGALVPMEQPLPMQAVPAIGGGLWLQTERGIERMEKGASRLVIAETELNSGGGPILESRDGVLWTARNGILHRWSEGELSRIDLTASGAGLACASLFEDSAGAIWVGGETSLAIWDGSECRVLLSGQELPVGEIRTFYQSDSGAVWIGTYGGGLVRIEGRATDLVSTEHGLFENVASAIVPDGLGSLIVLGNRGLARYSLDDLEAVALGERDMIRGRVFDSGPGIDIFEGNPVAQPRFAIGDEGEFYFPSLHGLLRFDTKAVSELMPVPRVRVRCLVADSAERDPEGTGDNRTFSLAHSDRDVAVQFSIASFVQPRQVACRYRLVGHDSEWIRARGQTTVSYSQLAPGEYRFEVEAAVADGEFGPRNSTLRFLVPPVWYELVWVKRLLALSVILLIVSIAALRIRNARKRSDELELVVLRRTRELQSEIEVRQKVEEDLRKAGESLEAQVSERTEELAHALKNLERDMLERQQLEGRLRESEKLEIVGRLAGGLAHDFNNILTAVLGETDLALSVLEGDRRPLDLHAVLEEHLSHVRDAGLRASRLTRQLLAYSRQQVMQPEVIDPLDTLENLRSMLRRLVPDDVQIRIIEDPERRNILIDPGQLEQVIVNLVVNAAEAMPDGGRVDIGCRVEMGEDGERTVISVTDSGVGVSPEVRDHIFEPFFSTKGQARGLGLASVQGIVLQSGGSLEVEEAAGGGMTFHVAFPVSEGELPGPPPRRAVQQTSSVLALLIDDEVEVRRIVRLMLEGGGVRVLEAGTHQEALAFAEEYGDQLDILVTDVVMPHMNGKKLSEAVRKLCPRIKVLFISGHFREELGERDLLDHKANFLAKPFDAQSLLARVNEMTHSPQSV